jgi:hypothetical protein
MIQPIYAPSKHTATTKQSALRISAKKDMRISPVLKVSAAIVHTTIEHTFLAVKFLNPNDHVMCELVAVKLFAGLEKMECSFEVIYHYILTNY